MGSQALERAIERVAERTSLLPSVVRHCLTAYADDPELLAAAWDEGYDQAESDHEGTGFWTKRLRGNPYRKGRK
jgi:hypothetical protein